MAYLQAGSMPTSNINIDSLLLHKLKKHLIDNTLLYNGDSDSYSSYGGRDHECIMIFLSPVALISNVWFVNGMIEHSVFL